MLQNPSTSARGFGLWTGLKAYWNFPRSVCMSNNCSAAQLTLDAEGNLPLPHTSELIPHTRVSLKMFLKRLKRKGSRNQTSSPTRQFDELDLTASWTACSVQLARLASWPNSSRPFGKLDQLLSPWTGPHAFHRASTDKSLISYRSELLLGSKLATTESIHSRIIISTIRSKHFWGQKWLSRNKRPKIVFLYESFLDKSS
ncbi:hypothetical protein YC2023_117112 [Brassica napus]